MKCQILFSGKNQKNITNLSSAELAQRVVKVLLWKVKMLTILKLQIRLKHFVNNTDLDKLNLNLI